MTYISSEILSCPKSSNGTLSSLTETDVHVYWDGWDTQSHVPLGCEGDWSGNRVFAYAMRSPGFKEGPNQWPVSSPKERNVDTHAKESTVWQREQRLEWRLVRQDSRTAAGALGSWRATEPISLSAGFAKAFALALWPLEWDGNKFQLS